MDFFSCPFFILWAVALIIYYTVGKKFHWIILLAISIIFYGLSIDQMPIILLMVSLITYYGSKILRICRNKNALSDNMLLSVRRLLSLLCVCALFIGRTTNLFAVLGNSYFTLKAISYMVDADRDDKNYENNYFKYLLYLIYLPSVSQGPFNRYNEFRKSISNEIEFDYTRIVHGIQRFILGTFKKLVITARLEQFASTVYSNIDGYNGISFILGTAAYALWFYTDFSGYMDMMIGFSETYGVELPENFRQPFFSKSIAEFWRRWHITLGTWFRDYIMMPFIQSKVGRNVKKYCKKKFGKDVARLTPIIIGTILVWICTALWHGLGMRYIIWGTYYCVIILFSLLMEKTFNKIMENVGLFQLNIMNIFRMIRTWVFVLIANVILFIPSNYSVKKIVGKLFSRNIYLGARVHLFSVQWGIKDVAILLIGLFIILLISILKERGKDIYALVDKQKLPIRWLIYYALIYTTLLFGEYGSAYDASQFFYMGF